jgi:glycosyltransferase involved in cell wall biosynthesis
VVEQFCKLFPDADIFTHVVRPERISDEIRRHRIQCTFISRLPFAARHYRKYFGFMPLALEELDLSAYDLVISSESGPAKGVIVRPTARHICYCHSPMRYIWDQYPVYKRQLSLPARWAFARVAHRMRQWDVTTAARVDRFVANSHFVAERIRRYYNRDADVVYPPVALRQFSQDQHSAGDYYLLVGELVPYKRADIAVEAFRSLKAKLIVAGDGPNRRKLQKHAPSNVEFVGQVSQEQLVQLYRRCRALVFPGEEDFGLVPVEAMACGRPVIAYGRGGVLETVKDPETGIFFHEQTPQALRDVIAEFERCEPRFDRNVIRRRAEVFSEERFREQFAAIVAHELGCTGRAGVSVAGTAAALRILQGSR